MKLEGNEIINIDDYDIIYSYYDCWKSTTESHSSVFQGIVEASHQTENAIKHRINAADKASNASDEINFAFHRTLKSLNQYGLGSCLTYELTFADYSNVIEASNPDASYTISNISLEFDTVTNTSLASQIRTEYMKSSILYDRILRSRVIPVNDSSISFSVDINSLSKSLKDTLLIFTKEKSATKFN